MAGACGGRGSPLGRSRAPPAVLAGPAPPTREAQILEPRAILTDNGSPWATAGMGGITALEAWPRRWGVEVWHGRVRHHQTQGKVERLHGTIEAEVFAQRQFTDLDEVQVSFDAFRTRYTLERPHEALAHAVPISRYQPSPRPFPETVPPLTPGPDDLVRIVTAHGSIRWQGRRHVVSRGLVGEPVSIRPTLATEVWAIFYGHPQVATIDLNHPDEV